MGLFSKFSKKSFSRTSSSGSISFGGEDAGAAEQSRGISRAANKLKIGAEDVVIAIMGVTGTGKSTFIQQLVQSGVKVGHSLRSCTVNVGIHSFRYHNGQTIYLIDTPGFNDTTRSDTEVLTEIAYFLGGAYSKNVKLAGIIYLHRITDSRMSGSALKNLHMFKALCGSTSLSNVVLATTMWDTLQDPEAVKRGQRIEAELQNEAEFWGDMVDMGSKMFRHYGNPQTALKIVDYIMKLRAGVVLDVQRQMVDEKRTLNETTAGKEVQKELLAAKKKYDEEIKATKESMKAAVEAGNKKLAEKLARMEAESQKKLDQANQQTKILQDNFDKIQKEGDERMKLIMDQLRLETERQKQIADAKQKEIDALATKQRQYEADVANYKRDNVSKTAEWTLKMNQWNAENERDRKEMEKKRAEKEAAIAQQISSEGRLNVLKTVGGVGMMLWGGLTGNVLIASAGMALTGQ